MSEMIRSAASAKRVRDTREQVIAALQDHFAHGGLDVEEFEGRVTAAHTAESVEEILALTQDLHDLEPLEVSAGGSGAIARASSAATALIPAPEVKPLQTIRSFMSATTRTGPWTVPRRLQVKAMMSSAVLDFRDARFPAGPVDLDVRAVMSSAEIIVPPGLAVETDGSAFMGAFDHVDRAPAQPDPEAPLLRIHGLAFMGAVEVKMRLPGETDRQNHLRQNRELREARRSERAQRAIDRQR
jgi:hypothetical protein